MHQTNPPPPQPSHGLVPFILLALLSFAGALPGAAHAADRGDGEGSTFQTPVQDSGQAEAEDRLEDGGPSSARRALEFVRLEGDAPSLDGTLTDPAWEQVSTATGFVQWRPDEGASPSEWSEARVLFGDEALYVGIRAWDSTPDSIVGILTRRDAISPSDWVGVLVDSYHDRRTGFLFLVNPAGVKRDVLISDDYREDDGWQAVWEVAVNVDDDGWTAEFRIPYSQLRFGAEGERTWGINFAREIGRYQEISTWAPLSQQQRAMVSPSGVVEGVRDLTPPRRLEVQPYSVARVRRAPGDAANPFHEKTALGAEFGGDVKLGVGSNLTLDLTVNPDFGQVEADPGEVNLTAFESFFPERRPFFTEGANIFRFGIGLGDGPGQLFHSRRIGRSPQGAVTGAREWVDRPSHTRILSAGKLSGRTEDGWSVGILGALTGEEEARIATADGTLRSQPVEPLTGYFVGRVQRDLNEGRTTFGSVLTSTNRAGDTADELELRRNAFAGGVDVSHRFWDDRFELRGYLLGSHVTGSDEAILRTQRSAVRYFQRPDASHVELDAGRTSLTGHSGALEILKLGGGGWRGGTMGQWRSPGFEANDLGFMNSTDHLSQIGFVGYEHTRPGDRLRRWSLYTNAWSSWTFGGEHTDFGHNVNGNFELRNGWGGWAGVIRNASTLSPTLLRGGPALIEEERFGGWMGFYSDSRSDLQLNWSANWGIRPESDSWDFRTSPNVRWRPSPATQIRIGPFVSRNVNDRQWVTRIDADGEAHYLFGRMDQTTVGMDIRADLALTPELSLQLYAQPFLSGGEFDGFSRVDAPRARTYEDRFEPLDVENLDSDRLGVDLGGGSLHSFDRPDFNVRQLRSNVVLRWEYLPGSTIFLVWAQARDHHSDEGAFRLRDGLGQLFSERADNTFMVKVNYWLNP